MTLQQQIWRTSDADLFSDLAKFQKAISANEFPEMIPHWRETVERIEHEIEQRHLLASSAASRSPMPLSEVPF